MKKLSKIVIVLAIFAFVSVGVFASGATVSTPTVDNAHFYMNINNANTGIFIPTDTVYGRRKAKAGIKEI